ncbi:MAG: hypothetical protein COW55_13285 [Rhodobacteraceae bacterium CG17_big_fil_post_rev_8_21_14_2_50_65_11]|nr:MAG: hypothetical protein COW55_13285 [Rhodobacteraceae bacterium CG17_big_fil_post_rev_8_21_14_2_50_65_11]
MKGPPLLAPLRDVVAARTGVAAARAAAAILTAALALTSALLLLASGLAALTGRFGFPVAALVLAAVVAVLTLAVHLIGRAVVARRMVRVAEARSRTEADLALALALTPSLRPLLPLVGFIAAFFVARRS